MKSTVQGMDMNNLDLFKREKYLNLESFRKNGLGVRTPVWFVQDAGAYYVITMADSGKVKRIRNNGKINIAPCKMDGSLIGDWISAQAWEISDPDVRRRINRLMDRKYGLLKKFFDMRRARRGAIHTFLKIKPEEESEI